MNSTCQNPIFTLVIADSSNKIVTSKFETPCAEGYSIICQRIVGKWYYYAYTVSETIFGIILLQNCSCT